MMDKKQIQIIGDNHFSTNIRTPLSKDAFAKSDDEKIENMQFLKTNSSSIIHNIISSN